MRVAVAVLSFSAMEAMTQEQQGWLQVGSSSFCFLFSPVLRAVCAESTIRSHLLASRLCSVCFSWGAHPTGAHRLNTSWPLTPCVLGMPTRWPLSSHFRDAEDKGCWPPTPCPSSRAGAFLPSSLPHGHSCDSASVVGLGLPVPVLGKVKMRRWKRSRVEPSIRQGLASLAPVTILFFPFSGLRACFGTSGEFISSPFSLGFVQPSVFTVSTSQC